MLVSTGVNKFFGISSMDHSPTIFSLGEIFAAHAPAGSRFAIVAETSDNGTLGDLVEVADGSRLAHLRRTEIGDVWEPVDVSGSWYIERWKRNGLKAQWWANVPSAEFAVALAKDARLRNKGDTIRAMPPVGTTQADLDTLASFQVQVCGAAGRLSSSVRQGPASGLDLR